MIKLRNVLALVAIRLINRLVDSPPPLPADMPALTTDMHRAYDAGDAVGMSVAGKLWQAPQLRRKFIALRAEQINLLSRNQAFQLYHLLVPSS